MAVSSVTAFTPLGSVEQHMIRYAVLLVDYATVSFLQGNQFANTLCAPKSHEFVKTLLAERFALCSSLDFNDAACCRS